MSAVCRNLWYVLTLYRVAFFISGPMKFNTRRIDTRMEGIPEHVVDLHLSHLVYLNPGGLEMEGVYRVNGGQLTMKKLRTSFDQGKLYFCE